MESRSEIPNKQLPQVLSKKVISSLVSDLDAGDVLECYYLTRSSRLHGLANSTIPVMKSALGLRYRPLAATANAVDPPKAALAMTLEYGPARAGNDLLHESIPIVHGSLTSSGNNEGDNNNNGIGSLGDEMVTWENEGKVYYTLQIDEKYYPSANYLASLSGGVLDALLEAAVDYPTSKSKQRRRYQPFVVVRRNDDKSGGGSRRKEVQGDNRWWLLLRSSGDVDFVWYLYNTLAELGVELEPLVRHPEPVIQLHASSVEKVQLFSGVSMNQVASFYSRLYACLEALATGSTEFQQQHNAIKASPTLLPTASPTFSPTRIGEKLSPYITFEPSSRSSQPRDHTTGPPRKRRKMQSHDGHNQASSKADQSGHAVALSNVATPVPHSETINKERTSNVTTAVRSAIADEQKSNTTNTTPVKLANESIISSHPSIAVSAFPTPAASIQPSGGGKMGNGTVGNETGNVLEPTLSPTQPIAPSSHSQQAAEAAAQAQAAADQAGQAGNEQAAEAAQAAATAAQKAADATVSQAAAIARDSLLSGDGNAMTQTIAQCLKDPVYGLASEGANSTTAYLYWDGSFYYKLDLIPPYLSVNSLTTPLPRPPELAGLTGGDFVDWMLALLLVGVFLIGLLLLLQQFMGRNFKIIRPLYKCQRWFFDPLHYDFTGADDESEKFRGVGGQEYWFGEDSIPFSMGGRRSNAFYEESNIITPGQSWEKNVPGSTEMEMVSPRKTSSESLQDNSESESSGFGDELVGPRLRRKRDPDMVELPNLTSTSKVAVPVSFAHAGNSSFGSHSGGDDLMII